MSSMTLFQGASQAALLWIEDEIVKAKNWQDQGSVYKAVHLPHETDYQSRNLDPAALKARLERLPPEKRAALLKSVWDEASQPLDNMAKLEEGLLSYERNAADVDGNAERRQEAAPAPVPPARRDPTVAAGTAVLVRTPGRVEDVPRDIGLSRRAAKGASGKNSGSRLSGLRAEAANLHMRMFAGMYASSDLHAGLDSESFMRRRATIDVLARRSEDSVRARRAMATWTDAELEKHIATIGDEDKETISDNLRSQGMLNENGTNLEEAMVLHRRDEQTKVRRAIAEQTSGVRAASEMLLAEQDSSGTLGKDLLKARSRESGIRLPDDDGRRDLGRLEDRLFAGAQAADADRRNVRTVFTMGQRYGMDAGRIASPADATAMMRNMAVAELAAGKLVGRDREAFVKQAASLSQPDQRRLMASRGFDEDMVKRTEAVLHRSAEEVEENADDMRKVEAFDRESKYRTGLKASTAILKAIGFHVEDVGDLAAPKIGRHRTRYEVAEEMAGRATEIGSEAVEPGAKYEAPPISPKVGESAGPAGSSGVPAPSSGKPAGPAGSSGVPAPSSGKPAGPAGSSGVPAPSSGKPAGPAGSSGVPAPSSGKPAGPAGSSGVPAPSSGKPAGPAGSSGVPAPSSGKPAGPAGSSGVPAPSSKVGTSGSAEQPAGTPAEPSAAQSENNMDRDLASFSLSQLPDPADVPVFRGPGIKTQKEYDEARSRYLDAGYKSFIEDRKRLSGETTIAAPRQVPASKPAGVASMLAKSMQDKESRVPDSTRALEMRIAELEAIVHNAVQSDPTGVEV